MGLVKLYATLRKAADNQLSVDIDWNDGDPVQNIIDGLVGIHPGLDGQIVGEDGAILPYVGIFLNGKNVRFMDGLDTPVGAEVEIAIFPPVAGG